MPRLMTQFERARALISQPPEKRMDHEIKQLVPWLRSKAKLFKQLKADLLADIMRNCNIETKQHDDIIIKQGDTGECFYIVLSGKVSIYILNKDEFEGMEDDDIFDNIIQYTEKGKLDRDKLGYMVTHLGTGAPFGEVALMSDSMRTASIVAEEQTDLLVVDRKLYNRSIKEVLAKEFQEKTEFIANNPLFRSWAPKYRKHLAMAMYKETFGYESPLVRQGDRTTEMFFILSGQVEIQIDPSTHPHQYPRIFKAARENEVEKLIKKATAQSQQKRSKDKNKRDDGSQGGMEPHFASHGHGPIKRRDTSRSTRICQLGVNESVGDVELTLDLPTYMQNAVCTETTSVLVLEHRHYVRLFTRRHPRTIDTMREEIGVKLNSRLSLLNLKQDIPFLQYVCQIIASQNQPPPNTEAEQDIHTVHSAEKEFLKHKGPLIDLYGPGSVFFLINLREKTKMRLRAKRGGPSDRQMLMQMHQSAKHGKPRSFKDMQLLTQIVNATQSAEVNGMADGITSVALANEGIGEAADNTRTDGSAGMLIIQEGTEQERAMMEEEQMEVSPRAHSGEEIRAEDIHAQMEQTEGAERAASQNHVEYPPTPQHLHHQHHSQQQTPRQQQSRQQMTRWSSPSRSPDETSPRPTTSWMTHLHHLGSHSPLQENAEVHEASLSTLEARLRHFLEIGNPKRKAQVTQLRRLPFQDMDFQPKPGNKVVVRRRDPLKGMTPASGVASEAPASIMARILSRPQPADDGNGGGLERQKTVL